MECSDELLYSFTEVVNIFDGLTTDTWVGAGEYIDEGNICINDTMISNFVSTTVYVSENGDDSNLGTFFAPVRTIQKAVDKVIAMNVVTEPEEGKPYKIFLLSDITSDNSFENNNNALVNIDASENPLYLTISKYGDGNATINANRTDSNTGRVMYIGGNANVTLKNLTLKGGYLLGENGGGIYSKGICNLNSCTISGNTAKASTGSVSGGGVYIESGSFTMEGCTIRGNTAGSETSNANAYGGGIYGASGTNITMNDTTIFGNKVASVNDVDGAGVYLFGAELTMQKNSKISSNSCVSGEHASSYGGGVYINNSSTFEMTSGEISENSAKYGGGVCVSGGTFEMNGGSISNNTVTENGKGVYVVKNNNTEPTFNISGDASITEDNDVYLAEDQKIIITENLSSEFVATITPQNYAENSAEDVDVQVLDAIEGINLSEQVGKFNVTKYNNNVETTITYTGFLKNTLTLGENPELTEDLYKICSTIKVSSADGMNAISDLSQKKDRVNGKNFAGKTIILEDNIELGSDYMPIKTFSGVFEGNNNTIELNKPATYDYINYYGGAIFNVITGKDAKVSNLNVSGEAYIAGVAIELENEAVISNCTNSATITRPAGENVPECGGIVGELSNGGKIENCINQGKIFGTRIVGGIVGKMSKSTPPPGVEFSEKITVVANCANEGNVSVTGINYQPGTFIGGICGDFNFGTIYNSYNTGDVKIYTTSSYSGNSTETYEYLGGIAGRCYYTNIEGIINCYNNGEISSESSSSNYTTETKIGGILGARTTTVDEIITNPKFVNTVNNCDQIFSFGKLENQFNTTNTKNNYYKKDQTSPNYPSYESTFANKIDSVINTLNDYSDNSNRKYLIWGKDSNGNIIFLEEISDNQGITP